MLDASMTRILTLQFLAGRFDPLANQTYTQLTFDEVDTPASRALTADGAQQGMVLLRNDENLLPLSPGLRLACIGPHCNTTEDLMGKQLQRAARDGTAPFCIPERACMLQAIILSSAARMGPSTASLP